jgi:hypothetical protein
LPSELFAALKQNPDGHKITVDREVKTVVTRWLMTHDMN